MGKQNWSSRIKGKILFAITLTLLSFLSVQADEDNSYKWAQVPSPINTDIRFITFFSSDNGIASGKQLIIYRKGRWVKYANQPPVAIDLIFPLDTNSIFITTQTKYQESELYFGKGRRWEKIWSPLANSVTALYFTDKNNGIVAGMGEIAVLKNSRWHWLPPVDNESFTSVMMDKDSTIWAQTMKLGLLKYNGKWVKIKNSETVNLFSYNHDTIFVVGNDFFGFVNKYDSVVKISTNNELKWALSFFAASKNEVLAAGVNGMIMRHSRGAWEFMKSGVTENLYAVTMTSDSTYWIAGSDGLLLCSDSAYLNSSETDYWKGFKVIVFKSYAKVIDDEYGVVVTDFNNDGLADIFTCGLFEANHLYMNRDNNKFTDKARKWNVSEDEGDGSRKLNLGACAADFDNDGFADLYVTALNGKNKLYKNIRGNHFIDYSDISLGVGSETDRTNGVITGDVDNDGDLDIFIANENATNRLYLNNGAGIFTKEVTESAGLTTDFGSMGCSFGDIDQDGDLDLYVANWSAKNILYRNLLQETGQLVFENITEEAAVGGETYTKSNAVVFSDIDNDADLDLFVTNRKTSNKLYINNGQGMFSDKTASLLGIDTLKSYGAVIADFDGDGYKDIYVSNVGRNIFYKNMGGKGFTDNTLEYGAGIKGYSTGSAAADFDNDGNIDLYVANYIGESSVLLHNNHLSRQVIQVSIVGFENNGDGIGAKLFVYGDGGLNKKQQLISYIEISGGSGYTSMNQRSLPVPVPGREFVDLKIVFPTGKIKTIRHAETGNTLVVEDVSGTQKNLLLANRWWKRQVKDPHKLIRLLSWIFVVLIIAFATKRGYKRYSWSWIFIVGFSALLIFLFYVQSGYFEFKNIWFSTIFPVLSVLILISLVHLYFERRNIKMLALAEQERIRENLSRDLHDDLASTISTIAIYLTLIRYSLKNTEKKLTELLDKTMALSGDASSAITDLIWAIKPQPESLGNLILRINNNFFTLFKERGIKFSTHSGIDLEQIILNTKTKKNIYLIIKEALNNILKYAEASEVNINVTYQKPFVQLSLADNGIGFDPETVINKGHGLTNMSSRADDIKAYFEIKSALGKGTDIFLSFKPE